MTRPLTLPRMGDVGDVSSLSDSFLGSLGSWWPATGSLLLVSSELLHWTSLHVVGFLVSSAEYPSGFVCNEGHLLSQYMILPCGSPYVRSPKQHCWFPGSSLLHPDTISRFLMVQGTCCFDQNTSSELAVFFFEHSLLWGCILNRNDASCTMSHISNWVGEFSQSPGIGVFRNSKTVFPLMYWWNLLVSKTTANISFSIWA